MAGRLRACAGLVLILGGVGSMGCGRTDVYDADAAARELPPVTRDAGPEAGMDAGPDAGRPTPVCTPREEECNGRDDDCDGVLDDLPPIPCELGGYRYCVAGRLSACPRRCERCIPGSVRVCFLTYCLFWGEQTCAADGRSFGPCQEESAPRACADLARSEGDSPALEQCCIDNGYCCHDRFDIDSDSDVTESLGDCEAVLCVP